MSDYAHINDTYLELLADFRIFLCIKTNIFINTYYGYAV